MKTTNFRVLAKAAAEMSAVLNELGHVGRIAAQWSWYS
jgi:hypothetical protein